MDRHGTRREPSATVERDPRGALSLLYAAKLGHLGVVLPFLAPWLLGRGFGPLAIGVLLAVPPAFKVAAPWTWGVWADAGGRRRELLAVAAAVSAVGLAILPGLGSLAAVTAAMLVYGFARAPILPFLEATSLEQTERGRIAYGRVRLWGSLGFVAAAGAYAGIGRVLGPDAGLWLAAALLAACAPLALALPAPHVPAGGAGPPPAPGGPRGTGIGRLFAGCALMQASHGAYYTFYSIHLQRLGWSDVGVGAMWSLAIGCEVLLLARLDRIVDRFGGATVLRWCLVLAALRWATIGATESVAALVAAQVLHAATYAGFHVAAIRFVYRAYGPSRRARGQAMYSGMTFGLGMFAGNLAAGSLAEPLGLAALFGASALVALAALAVLRDIPLFHQ